jgi:DNA-binding GntR family transcriptional regulator
VPDTLAEKIAYQLRRNILNGQLAPGAALKERDTAAQLGVSRTPMREAIRILAKKGLVELRPSRSPVVANPGRKEIIDTLDVLIALEELSGRLAVQNATDEDIESIRAQNNLLLHNYDRVDEIERFGLDMLFHLQVTQASHNDQLIRMHKEILDRMWRVRFGSSRMRGNVDLIIKQHSTILEALENRDADGTALAARAHLEHLVNSIKSDLDTLKDHASDVSDQNSV